MPDGVEYHSETTLFGEDVRMSLRKRTAIFGTMVLTLGVGFMLGQVGVASNHPAPGSADDPVVTKSYVDSKLAELKGTAPAPTPTAGTAGNGFTVLELKQGQTLKAATAAGLEVIVRYGTATAVEGEQGGLANVTTGEDLTSGLQVALNNLLIFARNDGRGIKVNSSGITYVLVRGAYTIQ